MDDITYGTREDFANERESHKFAMKWKGVRTVRKLQRLEIPCSLFMKIWRECPQTALCTKNFEMSLYNKGYFIN